MLEKYINSKFLNSEKLEEIKVKYINAKPFPHIELDNFFNNEIIKEKFIFDFFKNPKSKEIKIGYRFIFQSKLGTLKDFEIDDIINDIISNALNIDGLTLPGFTNK